MKMEKFSRENCDESFYGFSLKLIYLTFHCETFVQYSISSYSICYIEI